MKKKLPKSKRKAAPRKQAESANCVLCKKACTSVDFCYGCKSHICTDCDKVCVECSPLRHTPHEPEYHRDYECDMDCPIGGDPEIEEDDE